MVAWMDFRPQPDGTLGKGIWKETWKEDISNELYIEFRNSFRDAPLDILSKAGENKLLAEFQWTPLARMTAREARAARIEFIRKHPALKDNHNGLATALQKWKCSIS